MDCFHTEASSWKSKLSHFVNIEMRFCERGEGKPSRLFVFSSKRLELFSRVRLASADESGFPPKPPQKYTNAGVEGGSAARPGSNCTRHLYGANPPWSVLRSVRWKTGRGRSRRGSRDQQIWQQPQPQPLDPAHPPGEEGVESGWWAGGVGRGQRAWFDPPGPHVGQELVWDLCKYFLSQAGHAEDVVATAIDVVSKRDKL